MTSEQSQNTVEDPFYAETTTLNPSFSRFIVAALCVILLVSVLLFGAVDTGTLSVLAILSALMIAAWYWNGIRQGKLVLKNTELLLPLFLIGLIGLIQLIPFGNADIPSNIIGGSLPASMSLDPYATRFFLSRLLFVFIFFAASLTYIDSLSRLKTIVIFLIALGALLACYSILQRVEDPAAIYGWRAPSQALPFDTHLNGRHLA